MARVKYEDFGDHVRRAIRASSRSEKEIAKRARVDLAKLGIFMGGGFLSQLTLERLAGVLGLAMVWRGHQAVEIVEAPKAKRNPRHES